MSDSFLQKLSNLLAEKVLSLDEIRKPSKGFHPSRPLYKHEQYISDCFQALYEIKGLMDQLNYSAIFLASFRNTPAMTKNKISRYEYMIYHIEGYLLRVTGIMDRLLILVNNILILNLTSIQCKAPIMLINQKGKYFDRIEDLIPGLNNALLQVLNYINMFREDRNTIAHSEKIGYSDLRRIEMFHIILNSDQCEEFENLKYLVKQMTDKKVIEYKKDFLICNKKLEDLLAPVYHLLETYFFNNYEVLLNSSLVN
jgi:hypothetical protein